MRKGKTYVYKRTEGKQDIIEKIRLDKRLFDEFFATHPEVEILRLSLGKRNPDEEEINLNLILKERLPNERINE